MIVLDLGPGAAYAVAGLIIALVVFLIEHFFQPLGYFAKLAYGVAAILIIVWAIILLSTVLAVK